MHSVPACLGTRCQWLKARSFILTTSTITRGKNGSQSLSLSHTHSYNRLRLSSRMWGKERKETEAGIYWAETQNSLETTDAMEIPWLWLTWVSAIKQDGRLKSVFINRKLINKKKERHEKISNKWKPTLLKCAENSLQGLALDEQGNQWKLLLSLCRPARHQAICFACVMVNSHDDLAGRYFISIF